MILTSCFPSSSGILSISLFMTSILVRSQPSHQFSSGIWKAAKSHNSKGKVFSAPDCIINIPLYLALLYPAISAFGPEPPETASGCVFPLEAAAPLFYGGGPPTKILSSMPNPPPPAPDMKFGFTPALFFIF